MNNGVSRYLVVQIVVENSENCFEEDKMYKEKGFPIMINVQIVLPSTKGGRKRVLLLKTVIALYRRKNDKWGRMRIFVVRI